MQKRAHKAARNRRLVELARQTRPRLTHSQIAELAGCSRRTWYNLLYRKVIPTYATAKRIADLFDTPVEQLFDQVLPEPNGK